MCGTKWSHHDRGAGCNKIYGASCNRFLAFYNLKFVFFFVRDEHTFTPVTMRCIY